MTGERAAVLWMPHGRNVFASQRYWKRRRLAFTSQFLSPTNRAHLSIRRIEARLGKREGDDVLHKPKWHRLATFNRLCDKIDQYEGVSLSDCTGHSAAAPRTRSGSAPRVSVRARPAARRPDCL
jgi:hypothetical protein